MQISKSEKKIRPRFTLSISFLKLFIWGGAENNPVMSSISEKCSFHAKYDKNASTSACFLKFLREQNNT